MTAATHSANDLLLSRRSFLRVSATVAGGLIVSLSLDIPLHAQEAGQAAPTPKVYCTITAKKSDWQFLTDRRCCVA